MTQGFRRRLALLFVLVAGAAVAACGGSSGSLTVPALPTRPPGVTTTATSPTAPTDTTAATTTGTFTDTGTTTPTTSSTTTTSATTSTTTTTATSTTTSTVTATPAPTPAASSTTSTPSSSGGSSALPWILLAIAGAVIAGVLVAMAMRRRSEAAAGRVAGAHRVSDAARQLADTAATLPQGNDPATVTVWWQLVDAQQAALTGALAMRTTVAADDPLATALTDVEAARNALGDAVATDRTLRIGPPSPAGDQLAYSAAVVRERAGTLRDSAAAVERLLLPPQPAG